MGQKSAIIRYYALNDCFRNTGRKYSIDDLVQACNLKLIEYGHEIKKRQVYDDIRFMESSDGYEVKLKKEKIGRNVYYSYSNPNFSIKDSTINETEKAQLNLALQTISRFKGLPQFDWLEDFSLAKDAEFDTTKMSKVIQYEENPYLKGSQFLEKIYNSIINKQVLNVLYKTFDEIEKEFEISFYFLKKYNNRWYAFGSDTRYETITNIALDRIEKIQDSNKKYEDTNINFEEGYFDDIIGVTFPENEDLTKIELKIHKDVWSYIKTKPLHGSQKQNAEQIDDFFFVRLELIPNVEFESKILAWGEKIKVIKPEKLKNKFEERVKKMAKLYKSADSTHI
tara:strand:+ start:370 stop:1386 length:1017 start_codon:yes stop_codon:yes gene_type:complete